jgi:hypothetical protein
MISSPSDYPKLDVEKEYQNLIKALVTSNSAAWCADQIGKGHPCRASATTCAKTITISFISSAMGLRHQSEDGVLLLEDEMERGRPVSGRYLGTLLHD